MFQKFIKSIHKCSRLGYQNLLDIVINRVKKKKFSQQLRAKIKNGYTGITWQDLVIRFGMNAYFNIFFNKIKSNNNFVLPNFNECKTVAQADNIVEGYISLFGLPKKIKIEAGVWNKDFLSSDNKQIDSKFSSSDFYDEIIINTNHSNHLAKDIKIPWELSRCHQFVVLGKAYELTRDEKYVTTFVEQCTSWMKHNRYAVGINWKCPMEVAIRAVNWIVAFEFFKHNQKISSSFWEQFICCLYDHLEFLEHNWELYDTRTNNHYLSNLVGYLYICLFFKDAQGTAEKIKWAVKEFEKEIEKQVFDEGSSYEGSTSYHFFVSQLGEQVIQLCKKNSIELYCKTIQKINRMHEFTAWCTPKNGKLITIGDNDSSKIIPLKKHVFDGGKYTGFKYYRQFGLSIYKNQDMHVTLRHHSYTKRQPSGHFHNDVGSITVSFKGVPLFVDPGSYVYTPSSYWRNKFRSVTAHNSFFIQAIEPVSFSDDIFTLDIPERPNDDTLFTAAHQLYKQLGLKAKRTIFIKHNTIEITDQWQAIKTCSSRFFSCWHFTLGPSVYVVKLEGNTLCFIDKNQTFAYLESDLEWEIKSTWVSTSYGKRVASLRVEAKKTLIPEEKTVIRIIKL